MGRGPLVLFVHGYPQFWWSWRLQLPAVAAAGYRAVALDLRGFGASDKPPHGHDASTACDDLAAIVRSLGAERAVFVGHGLGAGFAWSMPSLHPDMTAAVAAVSAPHPAVFHRAMWRHPFQWRSNSYLRAMQTPFAPERQAMSVARRLRAWSGPDLGWLTPQVVDRYTEAMSVPFAGQAAAEYHRWVHRCRFTPSGARYLHRVREEISVPVLHVHGEHDPSSLPILSAESRRHTSGPLQVSQIPDVGHFVPEEAPEQMSSLLIDWLDAVQHAR
ncbi:alpha/beta fold hydrolase [Janibacter cremeus]|uniref:Pimeloyl-ACP methyl ester carboxylesterase n=1 Tax=Janibacter cremeus TaxID=1285192 RepID=A0A852VWV5_9MICO|nr:alpha/beta hydrolase [Janibacter cremeus]NYF98724.1 pimeloyl-ACP methyl ester carboxylesterase [Janibacter cremeus]